jgi:hypothetical protein
MMSGDMAEAGGCLQASVKCPKCKEQVPYIAERFSFGVYAGRFCDECCSRYRDNCGLNEPQGNPADLDEPYDPDWPTDLC